MPTLQLKARGAWKHWNDSIKNTAVPSTQKITDILVPTVDTIRYTFLMDVCIRHQRLVSTGVLSSKWETCKVV